MKFVCKVLWVSVYKKEIDNLRTNHQGVYVLNDNRFRFLLRLAAGKQYLEYAPRVIILLIFFDLSIIMNFQLS